MLAFIAHFNRAEYWASHEVLEDAWRKSRSRFYHGLILYASALVHVERRNRPGILAQLDKADPVLHWHRPGYLGLDVDAILADSAKVRELALENRLSEFTRPFLEVRKDLIRGSEPELQPLD